MSVAGGSLLQILGILLIFFLLYKKDQAQVGTASTTLARTAGALPFPVPALAKEVHPDKVFVGPQITPEYLTSLFTENTTVQAKKLVEPYIGKYMKISGILGDVHCEKSYSLVFFSGRLLEGKAHISLSFKQEWNDRLQMLRRGDPIIAIGKIENVEMGGVKLEHCELVES